MAPTDWFSIEPSLTGTHLMTLLGYSLTGGGGGCQQDGAGCHWSDTPIPQSGMLQWSPVRGRSARVGLLSAGVETLEGRVKGLPPPSICFSGVRPRPARGQ